MSSLALGLFLGIGLVSASNGDFSHSLFNYIAPLLALSGDQLANQYLTQRLGFLENFIFACSPLGILTVVTSAIRVAGPAALRALIGRSQEPISRIELELLRSTSNDVCELWDGAQLVRTLGSPNIVELVYDEDGRIHNRDEVMELRSRQTLPSRLFSLAWPKRQSPDVELSELYEIFNDSNAAPNLFLNNDMTRNFEIRVVALTSLVLQLGVLIFDIFSVHNSDLREILGIEMAIYDGLYLTVAGTVGILVGVYICCSVIESRTRMATWVAKEKDRKFNIVWLQMAQNINGQNFDSYAICANSSRNEIIASRRTSEGNLGHWTLLGTLITISGFICQLVGLRTMPYQAAIAHCLSTLVMATLRLFIRRNSAVRSAEDYNRCTEKSPDGFGVVKLDRGYELNELVKLLGGCKEWSVATQNLLNHANFPEDHGSDSMAMKVLQNRMSMIELCGNVASIGALAERVCLTIDEMMDIIWASRTQYSDEIPRLYWNVSATATSSRCSSTKLSIPISRSGKKWKVDRLSMEALLDLWISQLRGPGLQDMRNNLWLLPFEIEAECDYFDALFDLIDPNGSGFEPVLHIPQFCSQRQIGYSRILCAEVGRSSQKSKRIAVIGQSDLFSMCTQYVIMAFLAQMAKYIEKPPSALSLEVESKTGALHLKDPLFNIFRSSLHRSGFATDEDSCKVIFCGLANTGKLPDPLSVLPQLVQATSLQNGEDIKIKSSAICRLFKWKAITLANNKHFVKACELGISVIGAFTEVIGYQEENTLFVRRIVQDILIDIESGRYMPETILCNPPNDCDEKIGLGDAAEQTLIDISDDTQLDEKRYFNIEEVEARESWGPQLHGKLNQYEVTLNNKALNEELFNGAIRDGDVDAVRTGLLFDCADYPKFLSNGIMTAFNSLKEQCNLDRTDIIRLLILSGSGLNSGYQFNPMTFLDSAARSGNIRLGQLLLEKIGRAGYQIDKYKAVYTAIEYGQEDFVRFLIQSSNNVDANDRKRTSALLHAAYHGRESIVKYLISLGASIKGHSGDRENALSRAAAKNHNALGKFLIQEELSVSKGVRFQYPRGETSLHFVTRAGNLYLTEALLDAGWDVNAGERGIPLNDAIRYGHEHVANLLIKRGSKIDESLLHQAVEKGLVATAMLLISAGADVNALDRQKRPLFEAAKQGPKEKYEDLVKLLIKSGANLDIKDSTGISILLQASNSGNENVSILFLKAGASLKEKRPDGSTVLHSAAKHGHVEMVAALVKREIELDTRDDNMRSPLNFAAGGGHTEVITILLEAKPGDWVDGISVDEYQQPPLHDAINGGHLEAARILVKNKASIASRDFVNWRHASPLYIAVRNQKAEIVQMFMNEGGGTLNDNSFGEIVQEAVERGHLDTLTALLSKEAASPLDAKLSQATRHLPLAARRCKIEVVKLLLELGADVSDRKALQECLQCSDNPNFNNWKEWYDISKILFLHDQVAADPTLALLLRTAVIRNNVDGVKFWLSHESPVDTKYEDGKTILHYAAANDAADCLSILLEMDACKAIINAQSRTGMTALHAAVNGVKMYAPSDSHLGVVKMLVAHGVDISLKSRDGGRRDEEGVTALDVARKSNLGLIVKFLQGITT